MILVQKMRSSNHNQRKKQGKIEEGILPKSKMIRQSAQLAVHYPLLIRLLVLTHMRQFNLN